MPNLSIHPDDAIRREFIRVLAQIQRRQIAAACSAITDSPADKHDQQAAVSLSSLNVPATPVEHARY